MFKFDSLKKKGIFRFKKKGGPKFLRLAGIIFLVGVGIFSLYVMFSLTNLPSPEQFGNRKVSESSKIYDRTGQILLYEIHGDEKRTVIPFVEIPDKIKKATLAAEDVNFYTEPAFDWRAIVRALITDLKTGQFSQGGSTITQQLVKNVLLTPEKTLTRKIKELVLAIELESKYSKDEIFSFYLNQISYGSNAYGVEAASQIYFGKSAKDISTAEAALLASLLKAPTYYSPWGNHVSDLLDRKDYVLNRMADSHFLTSEERDKAKKEKLVFQPPSIGNIKAPHFSLTVKDYLINTYGEYAVTNGGLRVVTTLDWQMQQIAEKVVNDGVKRNEELYNSKNGALVAQDPKTGQILALVGSRDYFDVKNEGNFNVAVQGLRQPGSALKPFVYMTAFEKGYSPKTMIFDVSTEFDVRDVPEKSYRPMNFDGLFQGPISFEQALAQSRNVPAVKALYLAGFDDVLKNLHAFGITTLNERWRYGLSLTLGGGEVKLIDLVNAYATLAQEGLHHKQTFVLKVENGNGNALEDYTDRNNRVLDPQYPRLINQILSDADLRSPLFRNSLSLTVFPDHQVALKTGTSQDHRDAWSLGYTPSLVVGVWAGNNDNSPMTESGTSILAAVPIWNAFLKEVIGKYPTSDTFERPDPITLPSKPLLNGEYSFDPVANGQHYPQLHSILYYVDRNNPLGPPPENPENDSQFKNWETSVLDWARNNIPNFYAYNLPIPANYSFTNPTQNSPDIIFTNLSPANSEFINSPILIQADIYSARGLSKIEVYFNRVLINSFDLNSNFYHYSYFLNTSLNPQNSIELKATNRNGDEKKETVVVFH